MAANYFIAVGADDYSYNSSTGYDYTSATIIATQNRVITPNHFGYAYANVDTSGIPDDDVISAASLIFDESSYTASRGVAKEYTVQMWTGTGFAAIQTYTFGASPVVRTKVLNATQMGYIDKTDKTKFRFIVADPGDGKYRTFILKAYETAQANACRMDITHAAPSGAITRTLLGVGL